MKEIFIVIAYCPDLKSQNMLRNLIVQVNEYGKHIFLLSHSHIPEDIIKMCNYYFYDYENKFIDDNQLKFSFTYKLPSNKKLFSKLCINSTTILPVMRLFLSGFLNAKSWGYSKVHFLEHDSSILDFSEIETNSKLLDKYDVVFYRDDLSKTHYRGHMSHWNLDKFNFKNFIYNEDQIINDYKKTGLIVEQYFFNKYILGKKSYEKDFNSLIEKNIYLNLSSSNIGNQERIVTLVDDNGELILFVLNKGKYTTYTEVIINTTKYKLFSTKPGCYSFAGIGNTEEANYIKVYNNNEMIYLFDMITKEKKREFISNNYLTES